MDTKVPSLSFPASSRIFLLSPRNLKRQIARCVPYEFEDVICKIDDVELFAPKTDQPLNKLQIHRRIMRRIRNGRSQTVECTRLEKEYDIFFVMCQRPMELSLVDSVEGWKDQSHIKICWIEELWAAEIGKLTDSIFNILSHFDCIITSCFGSIEQLKKETGLPCHYIPPGIDTLRFSPYPDSPDRSIEFLSIGRRSVPLHKYLVGLSEKYKIFYHYDTLVGPNTTSHNDHRYMLANIAKRSKYFLVNPAKFNVPEQTKGQNEIGYRFFEGAASGAIMIGKKPLNDVYNKYFHWCDAVIDVPTKIDQFEDFWMHLTHSSELTEKIRRNNVYYSLLEHDWAHRWREVLNLLKIEPTHSLIAREAALEQRAHSILS